VFVAKSLFPFPVEADLMPVFSN